VGDEDGLDLETLEDSLSDKPTLGERGKIGRDMNLTRLKRASLAAGRQTPRLQPKCTKSF
jgi:hypothetical protein